jgi:hypothetical protein
MNIAVSFHRNESKLYEALIKHFETPEIAVYGNNLTHFFPRGLVNFYSYVRLDNALRYPDLLIVLLLQDYLNDGWLVSEANAFIHLSIFRKAY